MHPDELPVHIHGTDSSTLAVLPHTAFELMGPVSAFTKYGVAPLRGELREGLYGIAQKSKMAFGVAKPSNQPLTPCPRNDYSLQMVIENYAFGKWIKRPVAQLEEILCRPHFSLDSAESINCYIVHIIRAQELGLKLPINYDGLIESANKALSLYYFTLIVLKHFYRNNANPFIFTISSDMLYKEFRDPETLISRIIDAKINPEDIYLHPTKEKLDDLINCIQSPSFPSHPWKLFSASVRNINDNFYMEYDRIVSQHSNTSIAMSLVHAYFFKKPPSLFNRLTRWIKQISSYFFQLFSATPKKNNSTEHALLKTIGILKARMSQLRDLEAHPKSCLVTEKNRDLIDDAFPIIFLYKDYHGVLQWAGSEQRAKSPLTLGIDITTIATDNTKNQDRLNQYLTEHGLNKNVTVILFDELKNHAETNTWPSHLFPNNGQPAYDTINNACIDAEKHRTLRELKSHRKLLESEYKHKRFWLRFFTPSSTIDEANRLKHLIKTLSSTNDPAWKQHLQKTNASEKKHPYPGKSIVYS